MSTSDGDYRTVSMLGILTLLLYLPYLRRGQRFPSTAMHRESTKKKKGHHRSNDLPHFLSDGHTPNPVSHTVLYLSSHTTVPWKPEFQPAQSWAECPFSSIAATMETRRDCGTSSTGGYKVREGMLIPSGMTMVWRLYTAQLVT
jgi:hypothetical protein